MPITDRCCWRRPVGENTLVFPFAPLAIFCQIGAMFVRDRRRRLPLAVAAWGAVTAMLYGQPEASPRKGVDIGARP